MGSTTPPTPSRMDTSCSCYKDQSGLTREFMESADPHTRLIAHMSNRQLAMVESVNNMQLTQYGLIQAVNGLTAEVRRGFRVMHERLDTLQMDYGIIDEVEESAEKELAVVVGTIPLSANCSLGAEPPIVISAKVSCYKGQWRFY